VLEGVQHELHAKRCNLKKIQEFNELSCCVLSEVMSVGIDGDEEYIAHVQRRWQSRTDEANVLTQKAAHAVAICEIQLQSRLSEEEKARMSTDFKTKWQLAAGNNSKN
jgi:hypothetical protein